MKNERPKERSAHTLEGGAPATPPAGVVGDLRLEAVWNAIADPVTAERPGEGEARVARLVAAQRTEARRRERLGSLYPVPLRLAAALAPAAGLVLGLAITPSPPRLPVTARPVVTVAPAPSAEPSSPERSATARVEAPGVAVETAIVDPEAELGWEEWGGFAPPLLAELYLEDVGFANGTEPPGNEAEIEEPL